MGILVWAIEIWVIKVRLMPMPTGTNPLQAGRSSPKKIAMKTSRKHVIKKKLDAREQGQGI